MLRTIFAGLKGSFNFEQSLIERVVCEDEVDREIPRLLFEAGAPGLLPKDLATNLERFKTARHQVTRRILRMNKRLEKEFGEHVAEQRDGIGYSQVFLWKFGEKQSKQKR